MSILYLDCRMGAAGDMLAAALISLLPDREGFLSELSGMNIPKCEMSVSEKKSHGISGTSFSVKIQGKEEEEHSHHHSNLKSISDIVESLNADAKIKNDIMNVYNIIAVAESIVHGVKVNEVHFHEVGMYDAIADIAAVCLAINKLSPEKIVASPVHVGSGNVKCAHGILPVPAPATAEILKGIPIYGGKIEGELCTPTGAALLKYFVSEFSDMPCFTAEKIGYGMGKKEFEEVNCVRAFLGKMKKTENTVELRANIDDMTGEDIAYAAEKLLQSGALDVWTENIGMKKGRPGVMLCVLCREDEAERFSELVFKHTTTIGVREIPCRRRVLSRYEEKVETTYGEVSKKVSEGFGVRCEKFEFSDLAKIADENNISIQDVRKTISDGQVCVCLL